MPRYMIQGSYTQQGVAGLVANPEDRSRVAGQLVESVGGKIFSMDYCFGEFDVIAILEMPDDASMAAFAMAAGASGALTNLRTTVLIPVATGVEAATKAAILAQSYRPPGQ